MELEQQLLPVKKEDIKACERFLKDKLAKYARDHFGPDFEVNKANKLAKIREDVINEIKNRLGEVKEKSDKPKKSVELQRKEILFQRFDGRGPKPPKEDVLDDKGNPKYVRSVINNIVWETNPSMLSRLGTEFIPCDRDGGTIYLEDYGDDK
jgi:hypothetical protein